MDQPLVSCIMPTANRQKFIPFAINNYFQQDYPNTELIIIDDGLESSSHLIPENNKIHYFYSEPLGTIGTKRNIACEKSNGDIIIHWDDDDWYAPDWISRQVKSLLTSGADICGLNNIIFYSELLGQTFIYEDKDQYGDEPWLCGATIAYKKSLWQKYPFTDMQIGEDTDFIKNSQGKIEVLDYLNGFTAGLHPDNTSIKYIEVTNTIVWDDLTDVKDI